MSDDNEFYTYVFVRSDIPLVNQIVQACHAAQEAGNKFLYPEDQPSNLILFKVRDEESLLGAVHRAEIGGVKIHKFYEPDFPVGYTAAATEPIQGEKRKIFQRYKLWS